MSAPIAYDAGSAQEMPCPACTKPMLVARLVDRPVMVFLDPTTASEVEGRQLGLPHHDACAPYQEGLARMRAAWGALGAS